VFRTLVTVRGPLGEVHYPSAILDTGATHSIIPADDAERIGLAVIGDKEIVTAVGLASMNYVMGELVVGECEAGSFVMLVGPPGDDFSVGFDVISACELLQRS
jgi:predicted aspartyl protease